MHMKKVRTTITIDKDLLEKAKKFRVGISPFVDIKLREYLVLLEGKTLCQKDVFGETFSEKGSLMDRTGLA